VITLSPGQLDAITKAAEDAYPRECCGLLAGRDDDAGGCVVTHVIASRNLSESDTHDSFEVDPKVRFDLMRDLHAPERMIGHYHSHPNHPPLPSDRDIAMAYEPDLVWLITGVDGGRATETTAHLLNRDTGKSRQIELRINR
jgi:proteasome lid subunit RPN8/RPN11